MDEHRLSPRASIGSFVATSAIATLGAVGLFVLLDPRAQAYWATRMAELVDSVRSLFGLG